MRYVKLARTIWDQVWSNGEITLIKNRMENALRRGTAFLDYYSLAGLAKRVDLKAEKCLEIGCGSGSYSLALLKIYAIKEAYLLDFSIQALKLAKKLFESFNKSCQLIMADVRSLPFRSKSFDVVISGGLIEHFRCNERQKMVSEQCRIANKVLCQVPRFDSLAYWLFRFLFTIFRGWPFGPEHPLTHSEIRQRFLLEGYYIRGSSFHDLLTAALFSLSIHFPNVLPLPYKILPSKFFQHEIVIYATPKASNEAH